MTDRKLIHGRTLGIELCRLIGIDHNDVYRITIDADVNEAAVSTVYRYIRETGEATEHRYNLVPIEDESTSGDAA